MTNEQFIQAGKEIDPPDVKIDIDRPWSSPEWRLEWTRNVARRRIEHAEKMERAIFSRYSTAVWRGE